MGKVSFPVWRANGADACAALLVSSALSYSFAGKKLDERAHDEQRTAHRFVLGLCHFVRLCFMYLQFAVTASDSLGSAFLIWCKRQLPLIGLSLIILLIAIVLQGMLTAVSMFWAGLTTLIVYQATPLVRVLLQVWEIAAQHDLWLKSRRS